MEGWIKYHRKITESVVWTDPNMLKLWSLCLLKASHKDQPNYSLGGQPIPLKAGDFITGRDSLSEEFNRGVQKRNRVSAITLWRFLKKFEKFEMLNIKTTNRYSVVSIKNWDVYQSDEQQMNNNRTTDEQQMNTNKNVKNNKNDKEIKDSPSKRKKRVYENDSIYYQLAERLFKQICQNQEIKEPNLNRWSDDIRKMIEIDKRTEDQVSRMIDWATTESFWSTVILSAEKLRIKYDTMKAQANRDYQSQKHPYQQPVQKVEEIPDWSAMQVKSDPERRAEIERMMREDFND